MTTVDLAMCDFSSGSVFQCAKAIVAGCSQYQANEKRTLCQMQTDQQILLFSARSDGERWPFHS